MKWFNSALFAGLVAFFSPSIVMAQPAPPAAPAPAIVAPDHHKDDARVQDPHHQDPGKSHDLAAPAGVKHSPRDKVAQTSSRLRVIKDKHPAPKAEMHPDNMPSRELPPDAERKDKKHDKKHDKKIGKKPVRPQPGMMHK